MNDTPALLVACLCAQWCGACREYRPLFDEVAQAHPALRFVWVDIEDEAELVDPVEVENFPTLLIADAQGARFFGTVLPHRDTLVRLLRTQLEHPARTAVAPEAQALAQRLWARG